MCAGKRAFFFSFFFGCGMRAHDKVYALIGKVISCLSIFEQTVRESTRAQKKIVHILFKMAYDDVGYFEWLRKLDLCFG